MGIERSIFVGEVADHLKCPICLEVLEHPQQVCSSQHLACHDCIVIHFGNQRKRCPVCRESNPTASLVPSPYAERIIKDLKVRCSSTTCNWIGSYIDRKSHIGKLCAHQKVLCESCGLEMLRSAKSWHDLDQCPEKSIPCRRGGQHCKSFLRKDSAQHDQVCDQFSCQMRTGCTSRLTLRSLAQHEQDCSRQVQKFKQLDKQIDDLKTEVVRLEQRNRKNPPSFDTTGMQEWGSL